MRITDFEKAIDALGVQGLDVTKFSFGINGQIAAAYAKMGELTYLKWDANGRGFRFELNPNEEGCLSSSHVEYLDYSRDSGFDLTFD